MKGLRGRLAAAIGLVALLSVGVAFVIGAVLTRRTVEANALRDLRAEADVYAARERNAVLPCGPSLRSLRVVLGRQGKRVLCERLSTPTPYVDAALVAQLRRGRSVDGTYTVDGERLFYAARLVKQRGFVLLRPTSAVSSSWSPFLRGLAIGALVAVALAALAALALARAISRPVRRVAEASRRLGNQDPPPTVPVEGPTELASLAQSFNDMADQLARARVAERDFLLSVSHELKTPLTAIRGYAEGLSDNAVSLDEAAETIRREAERLERLVHDLLDLARMRKSRFSIRREPIDLAVAAREVVGRYAAPARSFDVELDCETTDTAPALGDADRLLQVVSNLVENALRVTPAGGHVRVVAGPGRITVDDDGPGLAPDELDRAFERFFLYSRSRGRRPVGTGLGLAIVKELTEGMGGSVTVTSEAGRSTRFVVRLPKPAPGTSGRIEDELASRT